MNIKKAQLFAILLLILVSPLTTLAAGPCEVPASGRPALGACVGQVYIWSIGIAGLLALFMMILGGYFYMTAAGNAQQAAKGKEFIMSALIGVVLLLGAYVLLNTINPNLVEFNNNAILQ
jgi:hypothetical protein